MVGAERRPPSQALAGGRFSREARRRGAIFAEQRGLPPQTLRVSAPPREYPQSKDSLVTVVTGPAGSRPAWQRSP